MGKKIRIQSVYFKKFNICLECETVIKMNTNRDDELHYMIINTQKDDIDVQQTE